MNKQTYYSKHKKEWRIKYLEHAEERRIYQREYERNKKKKNPSKYLYRVSQSVKKWRAKHPIKEKAHKKVFVELRAGRITKLPCMICQNPKSESHHKNYFRPLEIIWLCKIHHRMADRGEISI